MPAEVEINISIPLCVCVCLAPTSVQVEPAGRWFEARLHRQRNHLSSSYTDSLPSDDDEESSGEEDFLDEDDDDTMLFTLDPKEWKVITNPNPLILYIYFFYFNKASIAKKSKSCCLPQVELKGEASLSILC